ncbi:MAG: hypothetical protein Kow00128_19360 [Deltaproteobacteria bacterium]
MRRRATRAGFTLVEILLTLAIFSGIMILLLSAFTGADRTREQLSERLRDFRRLRLALDRIGTDLSGAFASSAVETTALSATTDTFSGKPASTLAFTAFLLPDAGGVVPSTDIVKIRYFPKISPDGRFLELHREESFLPLIENRIPTRQVRLADRLTGFRVELFDGTEWRDRWPPEGGSRAALPRKAAVVLTDRDGVEYRKEVRLFLAGQEAALLSSGKRGGGG